MDGVSSFGTWGVTGLVEDAWILNIRQSVSGHLKKSVLLSKTSVFTGLLIRGASHQMNPNQGDAQT